MERSECRKGHLSTEMVAWARMTAKRGRYSNVEMVTHIAEKYGIKVSKYTLDIALKGAK